MASDISAKLEASLVRILDSPESREALGAAFFITADGYLLTCYHVIKRMKEIWLVWEGETEPVRAESDVTWCDKDFALLKASLPQGKPVQAMSLSTDWEEGDEVYSAGYQYENLGFTRFPAFGKITGTAPTNEQSFLVIEWATNIKRGISGAPALNRRTRQVIGVIAEKLEEVGTALIIPSEEIARSLSTLPDLDKNLSKLFQSVLRPRPLLEDLHQNWGNAPKVPVFFGRTEELATLEQWILKDGCRLVTICGMGGIGKTELSSKLARGIQAKQERYDYLNWRSFEFYTQPAIAILSDWVKFLSNQKEEIDLTGPLDGPISRLLYYMNKFRCLLVLDNVEAILQGGDRAGQYIEGHEGYGQLFKAVGEGEHSSCLLLTSREKPEEIASLEGENLPVRSLTLQGLNRPDIQGIFAGINRSITGSVAEWDELIKFYGGNPFLLRCAAKYITQESHCKIYEYLEAVPAFAEIRGIRDLLDWHLKRLSVQEKEVMYWLAINREPVLLSDLKDDILQVQDQKELRNTLYSLQQKLPLESNNKGFTVRPILIEHMSMMLIEQVCEEIISGEFGLLNSHALLKATSKDYVRDTQSRLILQPIVERLPVEIFREHKLEAQLKQILSTLRQESPQKPGYVGGNILNLLIQKQVDLSGYDFSCLAVWQANLQGINLHRVNFANADLTKSVFTQAFGSVLSVTFSPDGKLLATGDAYGGIFLWEVSSGQLIDRFTGAHVDGVTSVAFSPDGNTLASGSHDQTIRIWEIATHKCQILQEHSRTVTSIAFNPTNGQILASGSLDHKVKIWDIGTYRCLYTSDELISGVRTVAYSPDGQILATGSEDHINIWEFNKQNQALQCRRTWQLPSSVWSVAFSPKDHTLATVINDGKVKIWDIVSCHCLDTLPGHTSGTRAISFSPDGEILVSSSYDCTIKVWDMNTYECINTLHEHTGWVQSVAFSPDAQTYTFASGSEDQTTKIWRLSNRRTFQCLYTLQGHIGGLRSIGFSPDGRTLVSGSHDQIVRLWDIDRSKCIHRLKDHKMAVRAVVYSPDGKTIASGSDDCTVKTWVWDKNKYACTQTLEGHGSAVRSVAFSPDGQLLASGSYDQTIKIWRLKSGIHKFECVHTLNRSDSRSNGLWSIAFSPDAKALAYGSDDSRSSDYSIVIWNMGGIIPQHLDTLEGHTKGVRSVAFSPHRDRKILASGSHDEKIKIWESYNDKYMCIRTLEGHSSGVWSVSFSPDGQRLASGGYDQIVRLWKWDTDPYQCLYTLSGHTNWVRSVVFNPNGSFLASSSEDETIRLWSAKTGKYIKTLVDRPYEDMNIIGVTGLTEAQKATLRSLGAMEIAVNHVESTNWWLRFWEKVRYKWRRMK